MSLHPYHLSRCLLCLYFIITSSYATELTYPLPTPASYHLPTIKPAQDGNVLTASGDTIRLQNLLAGKIVLLSFIYTLCNDVNGCPLAFATLHKINAKMNQDPELAKNLRLLTLSFDPVHDTPEVMRLYAGAEVASDANWQFLTTDSLNTLQPILTGYGQTVAQDYDEKGYFLGTYTHVLKVFLIDRHQQIRNIYSVSFLNPDLLINDVKTLLLEEQQIVANTQDNRYVSATNIKNNSPLTLLKLAQSPPLGLPPLPVPADNPLTTAKIELGRKLFYDRRLSLNNTMSCGMCHIPEQGFTSNELKTAVGVEGRTVRRNSPTLYNVAYLHTLFHDGRETQLETQAFSPLLAQNEMANPAIGFLLDKINQLPEYKILFQQAFADKIATMETVGQALASYQRTLLSANSPFDRWYFIKQSNALSTTAQQGFTLFTGKAGCATCHLIAHDYALFTDQQLHDTGLGWYNSMHKSAKKQTVQIAPSIFIEVEQSVLQAVSEKPQNDLGRYEVTQNPADRWHYRTPSLRNIALTAPYMHDGSFSTLAEVIAYYNQGGYPHEFSSPLIHPLQLTAEEQHALVAFLESLTGDNVDALVQDGMHAPRE
ncbi:cytochrome c peroxidase [Beggiatoa leptomitoformis]|uniref:Methylamine utilization protein MauG n=1 Tax=Beggiatoa leptomitoformis TaxID=288004 RepID=A0A2N9YGP2_9GAMM|nr:cytochrome c peroxidase [Beggiatoa leptomitoformis]ALG68148.1 photosynthetic protein synthase I [Beggiatoa leptomitoformis]AUI69555.1 photosynthetic protein synthase I [Beggiatoa leptomitoformis]